LPCFDQPDLKSNMTLEIITHDSWKAVSNAHVIREQKTDVNEIDDEGQGWIADFFSGEGFN